MAFTQWTASSISPKKSTGSAALISEVLVVVDIGFTGGGTGLTGSCGGGTVGEGAVVKGGAGSGGLAIGMTGGAVIIRGVAEGKGFVRGTLGWELKDGKGAMHLGGKGRDAGLTVY